jgi:hypothetical protein
MGGVMKNFKKTVGATAGALALLFSWNAQATIVDLTAANNTGTINGATYTQVPAQPTGSGVLASFVRVRDASSAIVQGYNTTVSGTYQNDGTDTFNHQMTVGQIGLIDTNGALPGGEVMRFLLDINQTGANPLLSLDEVQIFLSSTPNQSIEPVLANGQLLPLANSTLVYQMDAGGDNRAELDYSLNGGSGSGDMTLDITLDMLNAAFAAAGLITDAQKNGAYIYLYSRFGEHNGNNDGYEEWTNFQGNPIGETPCDPATQDCGPREIPEPNSLALISLGMLGAACLSRRSRRWWDRRG